MTDDPCLAVANAVDKVTTQVAVRQFARLNPAYDGAHLADILDILILHDSFEDEFDHWMAFRSPGLRTTFLRPAWLALRLAYGPGIDGDVVYELAARAQRNATREAWEP